MTRSPVRRSAGYVDAPELENVEIIHDTGPAAPENRQQRSGLGKFGLILNQRVVLIAAVKEGLQEIGLRIIKHDGDPIDTPHTIPHHGMNKTNLVRKRSILIQAAQPVLVPVDYLTHKHTPPIFTCRYE